MNLLDKYYNNGVNGVYFQKSRMANLSDYYYMIIADSVLVVFGLLLLLEIFGSNSD